MPNALPRQLSRTCPYVLSAGYYDAYYNKARQVRSLIARDFAEAYKQVDVILTPTAPTPAFGFCSLSSN